MGGLEKYTVQVSTNSVGYYGSNRENPLIKLFCSGSSFPLLMATEIIETSRLAAPGSTVPTAKLH